ncbi:MAG: hypothetical protein WA733_23865 [Methylocystis sp.]
MKRTDANHHYGDVNRLTPREITLMGHLAEHRNAFRLRRPDSGGDVRAEAALLLGLSVTLHNFRARFDSDIAATCHVPTAIRYRTGVDPSANGQQTIN